MASVPFGAGFVNQVPVDKTGIRDLYRCSTNGVQFIPTPSRWHENGIRNCAQPTTRPSGYQAAEAM
jgi:hypothetical protein